MEKKAKAEAKRTRRSQRKLELEAGANHPDDVQDDEGARGGFNQLDGLELTDDQRSHANHKQQ